MAINQNWMALVLNPKAHTHTIDVVILNQYTLDQAIPP